MADQADGRGSLGMKEGGAGSSPAAGDVEMSNRDLYYEGQEVGDVRSVLIVGAGPAGLMLAILYHQYLESNLARYGIDVEIVDDRADKTSTGRADGLQPKTIETFRQLRLASGLLEKGVKIYDICFWNSTPTSPLSRTSREVHYPLDLMDPYVLLVHQGMIEDVFLDDLKSRGVEVIRNKPFVKFTAGIDNSIIDSTCGDGLTGPSKIFRSKIVVGCDGAHSKVRKCWQGVEMEGESGKAAWGVLDGVIDTDFPDIWSKAVIHSATAGSMLTIPRERNMTRLYIELHPGATQPVADEIARQEFVMQRAKEILHPFKVEWKSIEWSSVYHVGQRVASNFGWPREGMFLAGDAAHTHSPKAAQGMNVSMHDSFNLAWKLNLVLRDIALPSLLDTYQLERKQIAQQLIDFDFEHANAFSAGDANALAKNFEQNIRFISGIGAEYRPSKLNMPHFDGKYRCPGEELEAGQLLPRAKVTRYIDANPVEIQLDIPLLSQFRIYFFVSDINVSRPHLESICEYIASRKSVLGRASERAGKSYGELKVKETEADEYLQPGRYIKVSKLFTPAIVTTMKKESVEISDLPPLLTHSPWTFYLDDIGPNPGTCSKKWLGGLDAGEIVIVNVRPDGYVGSIGRFTAGKGAQAMKFLDAYYGGFLKGGY